MSYRNFNMTYIELITVALVKRLILDPRMKAGDRLRALEGITAWIRPSGLTVEMLELVDPASDVELEMIDAARELDPKPFPNYEIPYPPDAITVPRASPCLAAASNTSSGLTGVLRPRSSMCRNGGLQHDAPCDLAGHVDMDRSRRACRLGGAADICRDGSRAGAADVPVCEHHRRRADNNDAQDQSGRPSFGLFEHTGRDGYHHHLRQHHLAAAPRSARLRVMRVRRTVSSMMSRSGPI
jgi:hypothetical protein